MPATAETIWAVPAYLPYLQPPLTDEAVASAEAKIGYKLPAEFVHLLRKQNGGYIRYELHDVPHSCIAGIGPNYPSLTEFNWEEDQEYVSFPLNGLVPFDGDGHWFLCLDYRNDPKNPSVTYADIECDEQSSVADSFKGYLETLEINAHEVYVLESVVDLEAVKSHLSSAISIDFDPPDTWAHGYRQHRGGLIANGKQEWVWITPNTVPRGFVRATDPRYTELKDILPGHADRFPELPQNSYTFSTTEGLRSSMIDECRTFGLTVRPLKEYLG